MARLTHSRTTRSPFVTVGVTEALTQISGDVLCNLQFAVDLGTKNIEAESEDVDDLLDMTQFYMKG